VYSTITVVESELQLRERQVLFRDIDDLEISFELWDVEISLQTRLQIGPTAHGVGQLQQAL